MRGSAGFFARGLKDFKAEEIAVVGNGYATKIAFSMSDGSPFS